MKIPEQKNHYIVLCQPKNASLQMWNIHSFLPKPISPSILLREKIVTNVATASSGVTSSALLHSPTNTIPDPKLPSNPTGPVKAKIKQLVLEALFPKKRKLDETADDETGRSTQKLKAGDNSSTADTIH